MGCTISSYISRVDVHKSASGQEQCIVYSTPDPRTSALRVSVGVDSASVSLRDYTFDGVGTGVDIGVRTNGGVGTIIGATHYGNALRVHREAGLFMIAYGDPRVRCGILSAMYETNILLVTHTYGTPEKRYSIAVVPVWYDGGKGRFMCQVTGPSWHSSHSEFAVATMAIISSVLDFIGQQTSTTITGLINNTGGPVCGDLNGSIINLFINVFNSYSK